ncbi:MAG TPA: adenylyl-sulfate kinase [Kofleriaceae bacterium]|nr:adenylyl-sulfate kinase [Kofleriaceae bacterium]
MSLTLPPQPPPPSSPPERGGIVWLTGLPGAGKSTLGRALAARLQPVRRIELLEGDEIRRSVLSSGLGFSREDRDTNVQRIAYVARLLAKHGVLAIVAVIAPYAATRDDLKRRSAAAGHPFVEVYVNAPLATVIERDTKGLYRRARAGELAGVTGVGDPYEAPAAPDVEVRTDLETPAESEAKIAAALERLGLA